MNSNTIGKLTKFKLIIINGLMALLLLILFMLLLLGGIYVQGVDINNLEELTKFGIHSSLVVMSVFIVSFGAVIILMKLRMKLIGNADIDKHTST